jgi:hypothetical protein
MLLPNLPPTWRTLGPYGDRCDTDIVLLWHLFPSPSRHRPRADVHFLVETGRT